MLGLTHPLHRRRVCLGIQKIKDKEEEEVRGHSILPAPGAGNVNSIDPSCEINRSFRILGFSLVVRFVACVPGGCTRHLKREVAGFSLRCGCPAFQVFYCSVKFPYLGSISCLSSIFLLFLENRRKNSGLYKSDITGLLGVS